MEESRARKSSKDQHHSTQPYSSGNCSAPVAVPKGASGSGSGSSGSLGKECEPLSPPLSADGQHRVSPASPNTPTKNSAEDKKSRRTSLHVLLPKLPSSQGSNESINYSPVSPCATSWLESKSNDFPSPEKLHPPGSDGSGFATPPRTVAAGSPGSVNNNGGLTRKESYKAQRKNYRREKKRVANELLSSLKDPSVVVLADWLKIRGKLKGWTKLWCVLKPGLLLLYKSPKTKSNHWVGTVLLNACQVMERPSKKDGFCFKLFHPLEQSIWAPRGPEKEAIGAVVQPLPTAYLIFRAPSLAAGKCWLDALELALRCSSLLVRSVSSPKGTSALITDMPQQTALQSPVGGNPMKDPRWIEAESGSQFARHGVKGECETGEEESEEEDDYEDESEEEEEEEDDDDESEEEEEEEDDGVGEDPQETPYVENEEEGEFGSAGEQVEELAEENKSLIWFLVKQVRPGMDLSKVVLPTFILEPRSFLDRLSDSYYHVDLLSQAVLEDDAFTRMKWVVKWYLSGLYKKPKGLRKPYNPILGETFRCYWKHPNGSRTFYLSEQVSHHPPVSAFYVTNRQDGFCISASILAKSKFYGNSTSAILDGMAVLTLLPRGEEYSLTIPYAHCKGILVGTLTMELGGKVAIDCEKTGYRTEIEFKLRPFLGGSEQTNAISGRLKLGKETLATIEGHWDSSVYIRDKRTGEEQLFWSVTPEIRARRLKRYTVPIEHQGEFESERLWMHVSTAIQQDDQVAATEQKTILEEMQRASARERLATGEEWIPRHFELDSSPTPIGAFPGGHWIYRRADLRPWDPRNDVMQYEKGYEIRTRTRHRTPVVVRAASLVGVDPSTLPGEPQGVGISQQQSGLKRHRVRKSKEKSMSQCKDKSDLQEGNSSKELVGSEKVEEKMRRRSSTDYGEDKFDSSDYGDNLSGGRRSKRKEYKRIVKLVQELSALLMEQKNQMAQLQHGVEMLRQQHLTLRGPIAPFSLLGPWLTGLLLSLVAQALFSLAFHWR